MNITRLTLAVDSTQVRRASTELHGMQRSGQQAEKTVTRMGRQMESAARLATQAFVALGATLSVQQIIQYSDAWTQVNNQIRQVTGSERELVRVREELFRTSQDTNSELETTVRLYSEMFRATRDLHVEQSTVADVTRTINNLFLAGGKAASETAGAVRQLTQGLAAGALRGDEFNSVAEGAPRILDAIAQHLGMARGELRAFAADGGITAEILIDALSAYSDEAQRLADMTEETFGQKMVQARNNLTAFAGEADSLNGAVGLLGDGVVVLTRNLDTLLTVGLAASLSQSAVQMVHNTTASVAHGRALAEDATRSYTAAQAEERRMAAVVASTRATVTQIGAERQLETVRLQAQISSVGRTQSLARLAEIRQAEIALTRTLTAEEARLASAKATSTAAEKARTAAIRQGTFATQALTTATRGASAAMALVGGPVGLIAVAAGGLLMFANRSREAIESADDLAKRIAGGNDSLAAAFNKLTEAQLANQRADIAQQLRETEQEVERIQDRMARNQRNLSGLGIDVTRLPDSAPERRDFLRDAADIDTLNERAQVLLNTLEEINNVRSGASESIPGSVEAEEIEQASQAVARQIELLREHNSLLQSGVSVKEADRQIDEMRLSDRLKEQDATQTQIATYLELADAIRTATEEADKQAQAAKDEQARIESLGQQLDLFRAMADPLHELNSQLETLKEIFDAGLINEDELQKLSDFLSEAEQATGSIGSELEAMGKEGVKAFRVMQRSQEEGTRGWRNMEVAIQAANVAQAIGAVLNQANGDPYTAFGRMAVMAASVASLGVAVGNLSGGGSTAQDAQAAQGTGTVLGDSAAKSESILSATEITANATQELVGINRGMLSALQNLQMGIEGATRAVASSFQISPNVFTTNGGISLGGGSLSDLIDSPSAESFSEQFIWGDIRDRQSSALAEGTQQQISGIMESIAESVGSGAVALGLAADDVEQAIRSFEVRAQEISLIGLTPEEQQAELEAVFGSIFDGLAGSVVPFISDFQRMGEGLGETLARVATAVQVTDEAVSRLGFTAERASAEQFAHLSTALIEVAGGMDQFISDMESFVNSFATEEHKLATIQSDMERAFARVNLEIPETRDGLWELMQTLDAGTASGRAQIAALLELSDLADEYYKQLENSQREATQEAARVTNERERLERQLLQLTGDTEALRALELAALDDSNRALQQRIWAIQDEQAAVAEFTQTIRTELSGISGALSTLRGQSDPSGMRSGAMETLRNALLTGDLTGTGQAAQIAAQLSAEDFTSSEEFRREQARTVFLLDALEREGEQQISTAEQSLDVLESIDGGIDEMVESLAAFVRTGASSPIETAPINTGSSDLVRAFESIAELTRELQEMKRYMRQTTKNTGESRDQLERWNRDGLPEERDFSL